MCFPYLHQPREHGSYVKDVMDSHGTGSSTGPVGTWCTVSVLPSTSLLLLSYIQMTYYEYGVFYIQTRDDILWL